MSKKRAILLISVAVAVLVAAGVTVYAIRNINEKAPVVVDQTPVDTSTEDVADEAPKTTLKGTLVGADDLHWGRGSIEVVERQSGPILVFKEDFEVATGPDLYVYLSPNPAGQELGEFASLGALKANGGTQEYNLPDDYKNYKTVVVWCRAFGVTFATAELH
jgi:hypothetical protein